MVFFCKKVYFYVHRKKILLFLIGSRRLFGTITHDKIAILIDTSGSMDEYLLELKRELSFLIWEQLNKNNASYTK